MTKRLLIQLSVIAITSIAAFLQQLKAQPSKQLSLEEAKKAALTNNKSLQLASLDEAIAVANYQQSAAIYLPQINFSYTGISTNNPLNAFGFKLQQKQIGLSDFNPDLLNHPSATSDFTTKLSIQQSLINMDAVFMRKAAAKQKEIYQFKSKRTIDYTSFEVEKTYLQLQLAYKALKVSEAPAQAHSNQRATPEVSSVREQSCARVNLAYQAGPTE
jgi:outer membrane protein TolC